MLTKPTEETKPVELEPIKPDLFWACEYPACACECGHIAGKCEYCHWIGAVFCRCPFVCESMGELMPGDVCPVHGTANQALKGSR